MWIFARNAIHFLQDVKSLLIPADALTSSRREWNRNNKRYQEDATSQVASFQFTLNLYRLRRNSEFNKIMLKESLKYDKIIHYKHWTAIKTKREAQQ